MVTPRGFGDPVVSPHRLVGKAVHIVGTWAAIPVTVGVRGRWLFVGHRTKPLTFWGVGCGRGHKGSAWLVPDGGSPTLPPWESPWAAHSRYNTRGISCVTRLSHPIHTPEECLSPVDYRGSTLREATNTKTPLTERPVASTHPGISQQLRRSRLGLRFRSKSYSCRKSSQNRSCLLDEAASRRRAAPGPLVQCHLISSKPRGYAAKNYEVTWP